MFFRLLRPTDTIPFGAAGRLATFRLVPQPGESWRMLAHNQAIVTRARFVTVGTGITNLTIRQNMHSTYGAPSGLEANIGAGITGTGIIQGASYGMPFLELFQTGTSTTDSTAEFDVAIGFPLDHFFVLSVDRVGLPWAVGDDLIDPTLGRRTA